MTTTDIKINIIDQIIHLQDENLVQQIQPLLQLHDSAKEEILLTDEMIDAIQESEEQVKKGEFKSNEQFWKDIYQWLDGE
ncbi:hypothetical protein [Membranihabitans maritimus]|uniref:hypothetical protein n=1 Tax=Membranihabitans maritimus TaxID=2904244 RepID=UPI001F430951|nr:hypothetical protein [Membranihabitans maritimus]